MVRSRKITRRMGCCGSKKKTVMPRRFAAHHQIADSTSESDTSDIELQVLIPPPSRTETLELDAAEGQVEESNDSLSNNEDDTDSVGGDAVVQEPSEQGDGEAGEPNRNREGPRHTHGDYSIPKATFGRLCRDIIHSIQPGFRVQQEALSALQVAAEDYTVGIFHDSAKITKIRGKTTLQPQDVKVVLEIRGNVDLIPPQDDQRGQQTRRLRRLD